MVKLDRRLVRVSSIVLQSTAVEWQADYVAAATSSRVLISYIPGTSVSYCAAVYTYIRVIQQKHSTKNDVGYKNGPNRCDLKQRHPCSKVSYSVGLVSYIQQYNRGKGLKLLQDSHDCRRRIIPVCVYLFVMYIQNSWKFGCVCVCGVLHNSQDVLGYVCSVIHNSQDVQQYSDSLYV